MSRRMNFLASLTFSTVAAASPALASGAGETELDPSVLHSVLQQEMAAVEATEWSYELRPVLWFPSLDVNTTIKSVSSGDVSKNLSDLFDDLEPVWMVGLEAAPVDGNWGMTFDLSYLDVNVDRGAVTVDTMQTFLEVDAFFRAPDLPGTDLIVGLRLIEIDTKVTNAGARASDDKLLIDPLFGARVEHPLGEKWTAHLEGSLSGFGFGTDLTWEGALSFSYPLGDSAGRFDLGYRFLDLDYADSYDLDAHYAGPTVGLNWGF